MIRIRVAGLGIADGRGFITRPVEHLELTMLGIPGDRHAGPTLRAGPRQRHVPRGTVLPNTRQLSLVSVEELAVMAAALSLPHVGFTTLGANVLLEGLAGLTRLPPRSRLRFPSGAVVVVDSENEPCTKAGRALAPALARRFVQAAAGLRGVVGWVESPGRLGVGDEVTLS